MIKGYMSNERQMLVLSKKDPFPNLAGMQQSLLNAQT